MLLVPGTFPFEKLDISITFHEQWKHDNLCIGNLRTLHIFCIGNLMTSYLMNRKSITTLHVSGKLHLSAVKLLVRNDNSHTAVTCCVTIRNSYTNTLIMQPFK